MQCPCGTSKNLIECCGPLLEEKAVATTPEQLMRSRYSAFALKNIEYIAETTDPQALHQFDRKGTQEWMDSSQFTGLEILRHSQEGTKGIVEFKARFKTGDAAEQIHHEVSRFRKQAGVWYFRDGRVIPTEQA